MNGVVIAYVSLVTALFSLWMLYERFGFRMVSLAVPLLASFSALVPEFIPVIIVSSITSYLVSEFAYKKFLFYGMRVFFLSSIVSSLVIFLLIWRNLNLSFLLASTLPGLLAYDVHTSREPALTALFSAIFFTIQWVGTLALVNFLSA